jgi:hypothetical protein
MSSRTEEVTAGASGRQNLGNGNYRRNWKTPRPMATPARPLKLDLGEVVTPNALFQLVSEISDRAEIPFERIRATVRLDTNHGGHIPRPPIRAPARAA